MSAPASTAHPLAGVAVLDLTNVLAGPFAAYQLACLGARVVKVESPDGDLARRLGADPAYARANMGISFLAVNAGKESIAVDLKHADGKAVLLRLVARSDCLIENFRPGVMKRLGLDYGALKASNPRLVYCAISGFGQTGPLAHRPAYDQIIQGLSGAMSVTGDARSAPLRVGYPVCDTIGGLTAAFAVCAELLRARATGEGAFIDVSMLDATLSTMGWVVSNYLNAGVRPQPMGNDNFTAAPSGTFRTSDGLLNIAANEQKQFEALADLVGAPHLATDRRFAEREARKRPSDRAQPGTGSETGRAYRGRMGGEADRRRRSGRTRALGAGHPRARAYARSGIHRRVRKCPGARAPGAGGASGISRRWRASRSRLATAGALGATGRAAHGVGLRRARARRARAIGRRSLMEKGRETTRRISALKPFPGCPGCRRWRR